MPFSALFQPATWGDILDVRFYKLESLPPDEQIGNVTLVPFVAEEVLLVHFQAIDHAGTYTEFPGGTLEPRESFEAVIRRELGEEAGARLVSPLGLVGGWWCHSRLEEPYRPHLPHPDFWRLVCYAQVEIVTEPTMPAGGEVVRGVMTAPPADAEKLLRPDLAALLRFVIDQKRTNNRDS
jgi:8-oxo-dGTP diphosphatase